MYTETRIHFNPPITYFFLDGTCGAFSIFHAVLPGVGTVLMRKCFVVVTMFKRYLGVTTALQQRYNSETPAVKLGLNAQ